MISVILCTYNRAASLAVVLEDLGRQAVSAGLDWELVVVDNNSRDDTRAVVGEFAARAPMPVRYLFEPRQGKSRALNTGIAEARNEYLALTDDDVRIGPGWVQAMADAFQRHGCDIVAGRIRAAWGAPPPNWYVTDGPFGLMDVIVRFDLGEQAIPTKRPPYGANMGLRRSRVLAAGGFREDLGPRGDALTRAEDTELCVRLMDAGAACQYVPEVVLDHPVEPHRATKDYILRWYYHYGKSQFVRDPAPAGASYLFGVPRYLWRMVVENGLRWATALDPQRRFFYKLQTYQTAGSSVQSYVLSRRA